jgi:putative transposase
MWTLPPGDDGYSLRWGWIKKEFTSQWLKSGGAERHVSASKQRRRRRGVWQVRFWEHTIEDENDFERHFDYLHYNPVKHGYVDRPRDWPHSAFHRWAKTGVYAPDWGCMTRGLLKFDDLDETAME